MKTKSLSTATCGRLFVALLLTFATLLIASSAANAAVFCVKDPGCPAGGQVKQTVTDAVSAAEVDASPDTIRIGSGTFNLSNLLLNQPVTVVGAGMDQTTLNDTGVANSALVMINNAASKIQDLGIRLTANDQDGLRLLNGVHALRVKVAGSHSLTGNSGIIAEGVGNDVRSSVVDLSPSLFGYGFGDLGSSTIEDSTLTAGIGILPSPAGTSARRVTIHATEALLVLGGVLNVANGLVTPHPDDQLPANFTAAYVLNGNGGESSLLTASGLTIAGAGSGAGIYVQSNPSVNTGSTSAIVSGSVITGVATPLYRSGKSAVAPALIAIDHSAYKAADVNFGNGNGSFTTGTGNLTGGPDPKFVDAPAGDYRPRFDSPLIDTGAPFQLVPGDDPDLGNRARLRDGDGDGDATAVRDVGAYEYQRVAPTAEFTVTPASVGTGAVISANASGNSDADGDTVAYKWVFGDGATAEGAQASHAYGAPGTYTVTLTAADASGLSASTTKTVTVASSASSGSAAPVVTGLAQSARKWKAGRAAASIARKRRTPVGTKFTFKLNVAASVRFAFTRRGRKAGAISLPGHAGANQVRFAGRVAAGKKLKPGTYKATVTATDAAAKQSVARTLTFKVVKSGAK